MSHNGVKAFDEDIFLDKISSFDTLYLAGYELGMLYEIPFHVNWQKIILFNKTNLNPKLLFIFIMEIGILLLWYSITEND